MLRNIFKILIENKYNTAVFLLVGIIVVISLGKTLQYYFYTDDYAFIYYLQTDKKFGWPYDSVGYLFKPVYLLFGTHALPYFTFAVITYFFASLSVYFFTRKLTGNKLIAL